MFRMFLSGERYLETEEHVGGFWVLEGAGMGAQGRRILSGAGRGASA